MSIPHKETESAAETRSRFSHSLVLFNRKLLLDPIKSIAADGVFHQAGFVLGRLGFDAKAFREERHQAAVALVDRLAIFVSLFRVLSHSFDCVFRTPIWSVAKTSVGEFRFVDWYEYLGYCLLDNAVYDCRYSQLSFPAIRFGNFHSSHR